MEKDKSARTLWLSKSNHWLSHSCNQEYLEETSECSQGTHKDFLLAGLKSAFVLPKCKCHSEPAESTLLVPTIWIIQMCDWLVLLTLYVGLTSADQICRTYLELVATPTYAYLAGAVGAQKEAVWQLPPHGVSEKSNTAYCISFREFKSSDPYSSTKHWEVGKGKDREQ